MSHKFNLHILSVTVGMALSTPALHAADLNYNFLQGGMRNIGVFDDLSTGYVPGRYLVDLELNGRSLGKSVLDISSLDRNTVCFDESWFASSGVFINTSFYADTYDESRDCFNVELEPNSEVDFDFSIQKLSLNIPQKGLLKEEKELDWDYGVGAIRANYNANVSVNDVDTNLYGSLGLTANISNWVATTSASVSDDSLNVPMFRATRALYDLKADLSVGRTFVSNSLVGGAGLTGVGLSSNSSMLPNDIGYTPVFSGVANTEARITLSQNGNTIYSEMVPPGPFEIDNVSLLGRGDVTMTITEVDGSVRTQLFPLTIVSNMLSVGELEYSIYAGIREGNDNKLRGVFSAANLGYGFEHLTLRGSALGHAKYAALGGEAITGLGGFGTLSFESVFSHAKYDSQSQNGYKNSLTYSKRFNQNTDMRFTGTHYNSSGFTDFSAFDPDDLLYSQQDQEKNRFEASLSHRLSDRFSSSMSVWQRTYWDNPNNGTKRDTSIGANAYVSGQFEHFSSSLGFSYSEVGERDNYSVSLSVSVPLNFFERSTSSYATVTSAKEGQTSYTAGVSSSVSDKLDYSASVGWADGRGDNTYSLRSNYYGDRFRAGGQLSQSGNSTTGSASLSGSVVGLPQKSDVIFTRNVTGTIAVANVGDLEGIEFSSSPYPTNSRGNAIIPMSAYRENSVTLSGDTLPVNVELLRTSQKAVPTENSVVYLPFDSVEVKRYLFQIKDTNGDFVQTGLWATTDEGIPLGFVAQNGVLFINSIDELSSFVLGECQVTDIKDTGNLQEVICNENEI